MNEETPAHKTSGWDDDRYAEMVENLVFANVYTWKFSAERLVGEEPSSFHVTLTPYYLTAEGRIELLYEADCRPATDEGDDVAIIKASIITSFDLSDGSDGGQYSEELLNTFVHTTGAMAVYPYVRETVQSLGDRLGINYLTMDLLRPDQLPKGFSWGKREDEDTASESDTGTPHPGL